MENYTEWNNIKMYEGHVRRLTQIKQKEQKIIKPHKNFRIKSQPSKSQSSIRKQFLPLPLVSKQQRSLLGEVVKEKTMNLREKEQLLQNYLLSRRILETNSVIDSKRLKKEYNFHKKVSMNMNKSLQQNRKTFSQLRNKKYEQLQRTGIQQQYMGRGRVHFSMKIQQIMIIKRILSDNNSSSRFNLIYRQSSQRQKKLYIIRTLSYKDLTNRRINIRVSKKEIQRINGLRFEIEEVRGLDVKKIGEFRLKLQIRKDGGKEEDQKNKKDNDSKEDVEKDNKQEDNNKGYDNKMIDKILLNQGGNPQQQQQQRQQDSNIKSDTIQRNKTNKTNKKINNHNNSKKIYIEKLLHSVTKCLIGTIELTIESNHLLLLNY